MSIIIQDGTNPNGANSFVGIDDLESYLTDRGLESSDDLIPSLILSYDLMDSLPWCDDHSEDFEVTVNMKKAQMEIAKSVLIGVDLFETPVGKEIKRVYEKTTDAIVEEIEYFSGEKSGISSSVDILSKIPLAYQLLKSYVCESPSSVGTGIITI